MGAARAEVVSEVAAAERVAAEGMVAAAAWAALGEAKVGRGVAAVERGVAAAVAVAVVVAEKAVGARAVAVEEEETATAEAAMVVVAVMVMVVVAMALVRVTGAAMETVKAARPAADWETVAGAAAAALEAVSGGGRPVETHPRM